MKFYVMIVAIAIAYFVNEYGGEKPLPPGWGWESLRADTANCKAFQGERDSMFSPRPIVLRCTSAAPGLVAAQTQIPTAAYKGKRIAILMHVRTEKVSDRAYIWLRADRPGEFAASFDRMEGRALSGTNDLVLVAARVDVPVDAELIMGGFALVGSGTISMHGSSIMVLGETATSDK